MKFKTVEDRLSEVVEIQIINYGDHKEREVFNIITPTFEYVVNNIVVTGKGDISGKIPESMYRIGLPFYEKYGL